MIRFLLQKRSQASYYEQVKTQLVLHILCSSAQEGEKLPPVRQTARDLRLNPNTVFKIYEHLQKDKLVETRKGSGTYVRTSHQGSHGLSGEFLTFASATVKEAENRFHVSPRHFAALLYRSISKVGDRNQIFLVINDDETREIDAALLSVHFSAQFVPIDVGEVLRPNPRSRWLIRNATGFISTMYHAENIANAAAKVRKPFIEIRRETEFFNDVLQAASVQTVCVVFQKRSTRDHYRDILFRHLYPKVFRNISFLSVSDTQKLFKLLGGDCEVYCSPLCHDAVQRLMPSRKEIRVLRGWISRNSLDKIRGFLLGPSISESQKAATVENESRQRQQPPPLLI